MLYLQLQIFSESFHEFPLLLCMMFVSGLTEVNLESHRFLHLIYPLL